jgi:hypothetical protein
VVGWGRAGGAGAKVGLTWTLIWARTEPADAGRGGDVEKKQRCKVCDGISVIGKGTCPGPFEPIVEEAEKVKTKPAARATWWIAVVGMYGGRWEPRLDSVSIVYTPTEQAPNDEMHPEFTSREDWVDGRIGWIALPAGMEFEVVEIERETPPKPVPMFTA